MYMGVVWVSVAVRYLGVAVAVGVCQVHRVSWEVWGVH